MQKNKPLSLETGRATVAVVADFPKSPPSQIHPPTHILHAHQGMAPQTWPETDERVFPAPRTSRYEMRDATGTR